MVDLDLNDQINIDRAVAAGTHAISQLPVRLQAKAQQLFDERTDAARRAQVQADRANPLHSGPTEGLH